MLQYKYREDRLGKGNSNSKLYGIDRGRATIILLEKLEGTLGCFYINVRILKIKEISQYYVL